MIIILQLLLILLVQSNEIYKIKNNHLIIKQNIENNPLFIYPWNYEKNNIEIITIEKEVNFIPSGAFHSFVNLKTINILSELTTLESFLLYNSGIVELNLTNCNWKYYIE